MRKWLRRIGLGLMVLFAAGLFALHALQRRFIFPRHLLTAHPGAGNDVAGLERLWIDSPEGRVEAWFLPGDGAAATSPRPVVIYAHGNAELIDDAPPRLEPYRRLGVSVLLPEYRGYGRSAGAPSEEAIRSDWEAFYDLVAKRPDVDPRRIFFDGRSIGGGIVCALATRRRPAALILESTFTSLADLVWELSYLPRFMVRDKLDNTAALATYQGPLLITHGNHDELIAFSHAERLAHAARHAVVSRAAYPCHHNDCPPRAAHWAKVTAFLQTAKILEPH